MANESRLQQTKGSYKVAGIVSGLLNKSAYSEGIGKNGKPWRSIRFFVSTSPVNQIPIELFGSEQDFVYPYSSKDKKSQKMPFHMRSQVPQGYHIIGVNATIPAGTKTVSNVDYDAVEYIYQNLSEGDRVWVNGETEFRKFENKQGNIVNSVRHTIKSIGIADKEIDFNAPDFKERAEFEQEIVVLDSIVERDLNKVIVNAYTIGYGDKLNEAQFAINLDTHKEFGNNFVKKCTYGTWIKVYGKIISAVELGDPEPVVDEWGGEIPDSYNRPIKNTIRELRIVGAADYEPKRYTEEDFAPETAFDENPFGDEYSPGF